MTYNTVAVQRELRYELGVEEETGRFYVAFPVSNRMVDYTEYYEIDQPSYERYLSDLDSAHDFVTACRNREMDHLLLEQPGTDRGVPS